MNALCSLLQAAAFQHPGTCLPELLSSEAAYLHLKILCALCVS